MITYNSFKEQIVSLTGRPDIGVAPHLIKTLAAICRSGEFPEDAYTLRFEQVGTWREPPELPGALEYIGNLGSLGLSVRRLLSFRIDFLDMWEGTEIDFVVLPAGDIRSIHKVARECPNKGLVYYSMGDIRILLPSISTTLKKHLLDGRVVAEFVSTFLTSNENFGWEFCTYYETSEYDRPVGLGENHWNPAFIDYEFPISIPFIWQLEACLDLVLLGTAASILRYAGHEEEARLMHGDFLIGLRQYAADRANTMVLNEGALGF